MSSRLEMFCFLRRSCGSISTNTASKLSGKSLSGNSLMVGKVGACSTIVKPRSRRQIVSFLQLRTKEFDPTWMDPRDISLFFPRATVIARLDSRSWFWADRSRLSGWPIFVSAWLILVSVCLTHLDASKSLLEKPFFSCLSNLFGQPQEEPVESHEHFLQFQLFPCLSNTFLSSIERSQSSRFSFYPTRSCICQQSSLAEQWLILFLLWVCGTLQQTWLSFPVCDNQIEDPLKASSTNSKMCHQTLVVVSFLVQTIALRFDCRFKQPMTMLFRAKAA